MSTRGPPAELSLQPETDVAKIQPDVIPLSRRRFRRRCERRTVLKAINEWADAWGAT